MSETPFTVAGLAAAYRQASGPTPTEILDEVLSRIDRTDTKVQAMVTVTDDLARRQAEHAGRRLRDGDPSPLVGIPIVLKDLIDVAGVPTTAGSRVLANNVPTSDAPLWRQLEAAGAVLVGKANTHEFAYGGTTAPTRNPWDLDRMVGGSSGGPAAALAAGYCAAAVGTDTAGSIRIPAALCGVAGLKTTAGRWSTRGIVPLASSLDVAGPLAHTPEDCHLVTSTLNGHGPQFTALETLVEAAGHQRLQIGVLGNQGHCDPGVQQHLDASVAALEEAGAVCRPIDIDGLPEALSANFTILGSEAVAYHQRFEQQRHLYTPYVRDRLDEAAATPAGVVADARAQAQQLRERVDKALEEVDFLLGPGVPVPAPRAYVEEVLVDGHTEDRDSMFCRNYAFANLTGHPALSVPTGTVAGLPVAVHLIGRHDADADVLAMGELLGRLLDWAPALASA